MDQSVSATVNSTSWSGSGPYSYTLSNSKILANSNVDVSLASSATNAQVLAYIAASFVVGSVGAGTITIKAYGNKPSVNLPIILLIHGKEKA